MKWTGGLALCPSFDELQWIAYPALLLCVHLQYGVLKDFIEGEY